MTKLCTSTCCLLAFTDTYWHITSSFAFKGKDDDLRSISSALGVNHIHDWAYAIGQGVSVDWRGATEWISKAFMDGIFGLVLGFSLIPLVAHVIGPIWSKIGRKKEA